MASGNDRCIGPPESDALTRRTRRIAAFLFALGILLGADYFWQLSRSAMVPNSESAGLLLYADDMLHGNWLLRGFTTAGPDSFWLTDALLYVLGLVFTRGLDLRLLYVIPIVIHLAVVVVVALTALAGLPTGLPRRIAVAIAILPLVLPTRALAENLFLYPGHLGHTPSTAIALGAMLAFALGQRPNVGRGRRAALALVAFILLVVGRISDPYTTVLGIIPIMIASMWASFEAPHPRFGRLWPAVVAAGSWFVADNAISLVSHLGGISLMPFRPSVIPFSSLGESLSNAMRAFFDAIGADFFGQDINRQLIGPLIRLAYLMGGVCATWAMLWHKSLRQDWLGSALSIATLLSLIGGILGTTHVDLIHRVPPLILMSVVLARYVATVGRPWIQTNSVIAGGVVVAAVLAFGWSPPAMYPSGGLTSVGWHTPFGSPAILLLGKWLEQHGFTYGYGGYWEASIVTVATHGRVKVRPVVSTKVSGPGVGPTGLPARSWRIVSYCAMSKIDWYGWYGGNTDGRFLVIDPSSQWDRDTGVSSAVAINTFGHPAGTYRVGPYVVLTWDERLRVEPTLACE